MLENSAIIRDSRTTPLLNDLNNSVSNSASIAECQTQDNSRQGSPYCRRGKLGDVSSEKKNPFSIYDLEAHGSTASRTSSMNFPKIRECGYEGCKAIAIGGKCDFRVCCSTGCNRLLCKEHTAKTENSEEDGLHNKVCVDCKPRVDKLTFYWCIVLIGTPFLLSLPAIFLYANQTGNP